MRIPSQFFRCTIPACQIAKSHESIRHSGDSVELRSDVKLPFLKRRLVTRGNDTFEAVGKGFGAKPCYTLVINRRLLHIGITESRRPRPATQDLHRRLYLRAMRKRLRARQITLVVNMNSMLVLVHIHDEGIEEMGVVILRRELQLLAAHRDIKSSTYARIHRSFLLHLGVQIEHAGGRQYKRIIGDSVRRTIAHAGTRPQRPPLEWRITDIHSRSHKETVPRGVIGSHTCYQRENLVVLEVILGKDTGRQLPTVQVKRRTERGKRKKIKVFSVLIEVEGYTGTQTMVVIYFATPLKIALIDSIKIRV